MTITELVVESHARAVAKGFWEASDNVPEKLMLIVTEIGEAMEELRNPYSVLDEVELVDGKPEGFLVELADAMIRIADLAGYVSRTPDAFQNALIEKSAYNEHRPKLHGRTR